MSFDPVLQARIDAVRPKLKGGDPISDVGGLATLQAKLANREGAGGFVSNVADLKAAIAEMESTS